MDAVEALIEAIPEMLLLYDAEGVVLRVNRAAEGELGTGLADRPLREIVAVARDEELDRHIDTVLRRGGHRFVTRVRAEGDRLVEVVVNSSRFSYRGRDAILSILHDQTQQRRDEEERQLLVAAVEQAAESIAVAGADGRLRYVNAAFESNTGYSREEALGRPLELLEDEETLGRDWSRMRAAIARGENWGGRLPRTRRDGESYLSEGTIYPVRDETGAITHFVAVERDVTESVELEQALTQAQKMEAIGTLAGGVAHDFNNLLTGILGYANLIQSVAPATEAAQMAEIIESSADRAAELTRQLLGFARRGKHRNVPLDLNGTVRHVCKLLSRTIEKKITIIERLCREDTAMLGDPAQMEQALLNLALNASYAMSDRPSGTLTFATERVRIDEEYCARHPGAEPGAYVMVSVTDDGCGIPPDVRERIFEPFFTTKKPGEGTGMGLSMVYGVAKNHGGTVRVYSEVGHGTCFRIYLPAGSGDDVDEPEAGVDVAVPGTGRILVVDDEDVVRRTTASMLRHLGYEVLLARDGAEAVEIYRDRAATIDLVVVDMVMPRMGGHDCFIELRRINPNVRAVLSTGFGLNHVAQAILDEGVLGFAQKPFRVAPFSHVISTAMRGERCHGPAAGVVESEG